MEKETRRSLPFSTELQLAAALRYFASSEFQLDVGSLLHMSESVVSRAIHNVCVALDSVFNEFVTWPTAQDCTRHKTAFHRIAGFPNVVGAIDCTHIRILKPREDTVQYINRKSYPSLNIQAVCDMKGRFLNLEVNWPGSCHDAFILRQSEVWRHMEESPHHGLILGDSAYPLRHWLITPILAPAAPSEIRFNNSHAKTRSVVERAFGVWKRRFHLLHSENRHSRVEDVVLDIRACGVLHNIAVQRNQEDFDEPFPDEQPLPVPYEGEESGHGRRAALVNLF